MVASKGKRNREIEIYREEKTEERNGKDTMNSRECEIEQDRREMTAGEMSGKVIKNHIQKEHLFHIHMFKSEPMEALSLM